MSCMTDLLDGALVIAGDQKELALRAITEALGVTAVGSARAELSAIGFSVDDHQVPGALVVNGFRGVFDDTVEKVLATRFSYVKPLPGGKAGVGFVRRSGGGRRRCGIGGV